jgi:uncharacterized cofD-like protein
MSTCDAHTQLQVAVLGGGTGIFAVLRGLHQNTPNITAIVSMADNGGSSGRLRDEFGYLPPGDVRRCLVALAPDDQSIILRKLFEHRFARGTGLNGHTFGNLLLTALTDLLGSTAEAIDEAGRLLRINGRVLPVTLTSTSLCARLDDGHLICGETDIDVRKMHRDIPIAEVYLEPEAEVYPPVLDSLREADLIVLGPGDLYTSVIPTLLVRGVAEAIRASNATCVYVCNIMTKHCETDGFAASDFIRELHRYLGAPDVLDCAVLNYHESLPRTLYEQYRAEHAEPVTIDLARCYEAVAQLAIRPLTAAGTLVRHDPERLATTLLEVAATCRHVRSTCPPNDDTPPQRLEASA